MQFETYSLRRFLAQDSINITNLLHSFSTVDEKFNTFIT